MKNIFKMIFFLNFSYKISYKYCFFNSLSSIKKQNVGILYPQNISKIFEINFEKKFF